MHLASAAIDIDDTDIAAEWIRKVGRIVVVDSLQARLQVGRAVGIGGKSQFLDGLTLARSTLDVETPRFPFEVFLTYFEQVGSDLLSFVTYLTCRQRRCCAGYGSATAGISSET